MDKIAELIDLRLAAGIMIGLPLLMLVLSMVKRLWGPVFMAAFTLVLTGGSWIALVIMRGRMNAAPPGADSVLLWIVGVMVSTGGVIFSGLMIMITFGLTVIEVSNKNRRRAQARWRAKYEEQVAQGHFDVERWADG